MPSKRKKHPKLPNGFGSIKVLSGNRRNPYAIYPPTKEFSHDGTPITPAALAYVDDWYKGFYVLMAYKNGTFSQNTLAELNQITTTDSIRNHDLVEKIIAAYNSSSSTASDSKTFSSVYDDFYDYKFNRDKNKNYSNSARYSTRAAYKNCSVLHNKIFKSLRAKDLQDVVDNCPLKHASKELIVSLFHQMYAYADMFDLCDKDYSTHIRIYTQDDDEKGVPFSEAEIDALWKHREDNDIIRGILIMIYSGFRISAYSKMKISLEENYFLGGVKTASAKDRTVPIHPLIRPMVNPEMKLFTVSDSAFRDDFTAALAAIGITKHTPHDCRHTFSWLCDKYHVDPLSKKMLLGHSLGSDVTASRYGHRTVEELRNEVNKIKHW